MTDHELQSQRLEAQRDRLFCDLKTDEEKSAFFLSGRGYETGVIAHSIQNDVAMAYHRCSEYRKEMEALQVECEKLRKDAERYRWLKKSAFCNVWERGDGVALVVPRATMASIDSKIDAALAAHRKQGDEQ